MLIFTHRIDVQNASGLSHHGRRQMADAVSWAHFGERESAWQGKYHKGEERINITGNDRNVEGKRLKTLTVGGSRCTSVKLCRKFNNAATDLVTTEQQA